MIDLITPPNLIRSETFIRTAASRRIRVNGNKTHLLDKIDVWAGTPI